MNGRVCVFGNCEDCILNFACVFSFHMDAVAVRESSGSFLVDRSTMRFGLIALFLVSFKILTRRKPLLRSVTFNLEESAEVKKWVGKSVVLRSSNESGVVIGYSDHLKRFDVSVAPLSRRVFVDEADLVLDKKSERLQSHGMKLGQVIYNKKRCGIVSDFKDIERLGGAYLITDEDGSLSKLFDKHTKTQQWFTERLTNECFSSHGIFVDAKGNDLIDLLRRQLSMDNRHAAFLQFVSGGVRSQDMKELPERLFRIAPTMKSTRWPYMA